MKYKATNLQTRRSLTGSWEDLKNLDKRIWELIPQEAEPPQSHNPLLSHPPLAYVQTRVTSNPALHCQPGIFWLPIQSLSDLTSIPNSRPNSIKRIGQAMKEEYCD